MVTLVPELFCEQLQEKVTRVVTKLRRETADLQRPKSRLFFTQKLVLTWSVVDGYRATVTTAKACEDSREVSNPTLPSREIQLWLQDKSAVLPNGRYLVGATVAVSRLNGSRGVHTTAGLEGSGSAEEFKFYFHEFKPSFVQSPGLSGVFLK